MKEFGRNRRVAEQLQRDLAVMIRDEISLPKGYMVTLSAVEVAPDMSQAQVFISVLPSDSEMIDTILRQLNHAAGFLRHQLGRVLHMRRIPVLHFRYDKTIEEGARISSLIHKAVGKE